MHEDAVLLYQGHSGDGRMLCMQARKARAACADAVRRPTGGPPHVRGTPTLPRTLLFPGAQVWRGEMAVPGVAAGYELVADYTAGHPAMAAMLGHGMVRPARPAPDMPAHPRISCAVSPAKHTPQDS